MSFWLEVMITTVGSVREKATILRLLGCEEKRIKDLKRGK